MSKIGVEFEMVLYVNKAKLNPLHSGDATWTQRDNKINQLKVKWNRFIKEYKTDGSVCAMEGADRDKWFGQCVEWITKPINTKELPLFFENLADSVKDCSINSFDSKKDFAIFFNKSTGTHVHYSSKYMQSKTRELCIFGDNVLLNRLIRQIHQKCNYPTIKQDFKRRFTNDKSSIFHNRYKQINVSDAKGHGTIEFRLFNLHGITTEQFIPCMKHIINDLVIKLLEEKIREYKKKLIEINVLETTLARQNKQTIEVTI